NTWPVRKPITKSKHCRMNSAPSSENMAKPGTNATFGIDATGSNMTQPRWGCGGWPRFSQDRCAGPMSAPILGFVTESRWDSGNQNFPLRSGFNRNLYSPNVPVSDPHPQRGCVPRPRVDGRHEHLPLLGSSVHSP